MLREIKLSSAENAHVSDLRWNPCIPSALCTITTDNTVGSFNITAEKNSTVLTVLEKLEKLEALCVAWSPKGKQLVVGCKNGNLLQLKPDLKVARNIAGPNPSIGSIIGLLWISNYQFCAAYFEPQEPKINVLIIDAPKGEANAIFTPYEDITYGTPGVEGEEGCPRYYFEHVPEWGIIIAASSGSSEVAVLGSKDNGANWVQWLLPDSGRADLPLIGATESYPVGLAVDRTAVNKLLWGGEGGTLPHPVPIIHIFGTSGLLCSSHMVNLMPGIPGICSPPTEIVPLANQPRMSLAPSEISFNLAGGLTSTPRPKQIETITQERPKTVPSASLFGNIPKVPPPQPQVGVHVVKPQIETVEIPAPKIETPVIPHKEMNQPEKTGIDDNICIQAYQEEYCLFEKEMNNRKDVQTVDIGSATDRSQLIEMSERMDRFLVELQETTASLTSEISCLKSLVFQTFAWLEETKSKCSSDSSNNPQNDGDNNNKLKELRSRMYYVQSQMAEARRVLDDEWLEHINKEKSKMKVPKLEFVYQNMRRHSQILATEKSKIEALVKKWKFLTRGDMTSSLNTSMANMSLISIMGHGNVTNGAIDQRCKTISSRTCSFSREKQTKLRNLLNTSTTKIIKAATPSPIQDRLEATLSSLAASNPPKQVKEQKPKAKSEPKPKQVIITSATPTTQAPKNPSLTSLDRMIANIGGQPNANAQNKTSSLTTAAVPCPTIQSSPGDSVPRISGFSVTQTPITGQPRVATFFDTPQTPKSASAVPSGLRSVSVAEVSPFASTASRTSALPALPPPLIGTGVTAASAPPKPFSNIDQTVSFTSVTPKTDGPPMSSMSMGVTPRISPPSTEPAVVQTPPPQTNPQTSFSFSSPVQPPTNQVPSYPSTQKTPSTTVTTSSMNANTSPLQSFSFASKPASSTSFSFASKPATSPPSSATQSLDLSSMGLDLQASSNTLVENLTPASTMAGTNLFGSTGSASSGSIFGGASAAPKDKTPGSIFGSPGFSSIFGGSTGSNSPASAFGGGDSSAAVKTQIFGGSAASTPGSVFGGSPTTPGKPTETPVATSPPSAFENPVNSGSNSVFGNISSTSNSPSLFGGNSVPPNTSMEGGTTMPTQIFGSSTSSIMKPPTFSGETVPASTATPFGRPPDVKPSMFGGTATGAAPFSLFGGNTTGSSGQSIFGGTTASPTAAPPFGSPPPNQNTSSVFGTVQSTSPTQSMFGGAAVAAGVGPTAAAPAFGQTATFGSKPEFGSIFGAAKPVFGGGFGAAAFPAAPQLACKCWLINILAVSQLVRVTTFVYPGWTCPSMRTRKVSAKNNHFHLPLLL